VASKIAKALLKVKPEKMKWKRAEHKENRRGKEGYTGLADCLTDARHVRGGNRKPGIHRLGGSPAESLTA